MTKFKKLPVALLFTALVSLVSADIETVTLQQGVDGYSGCKDTYLIGPDEINGEIDTVPKADAAELTLHGYH